ncbi:predicted protein [Naegleria gruberi]|uniref:Predicted protein n=1 Tax=Naegleria gruberi TaxID=5762 RepID=D2UZU2_NAEGR|nr:uncharacterized protein NAEGRDRAFT_62063 [Naegleria gruberi]EFC49993.1 predicted protein [Naegleria gruberi]|eukprot:XP_002682737.1 predicted protein [Naegleria gruberi strain NEG-M]
MTSNTTVANDALTKVKENVEKLKKDALNLVNNVKTKKQLESDDLRVVSLALLTLWTVLSLLLPGVIRFILASGLSFSISDNYDSVRVVDEFIRLSGCFTLALFILNYLSINWNNDAQTDVLRVMAFFNALVVAVGILNLVSGGSFAYLLLSIVAGGLAFFYAKASKLF